MGKLPLPSGFVPLRAVFFQIAVAEAIKALGEKCPPISDETKEAVSKYQNEYLSFEIRARVYKSRKAAAMSIQEPPQKPDCPAEVRDFLNALQVNGTSIKKFEGAVRQQIKSGSLAAFVVQDGGLLRPLSLREMDFRTLPPEPVVLQKSDVDSLLNPRPQQQEAPASATAQPIEITPDPKTESNRGARPRIDYKALESALQAVAKNLDGDGWIERQSSEELAERAVARMKADGVAVRKIPASDTARKHFDGMRKDGRLP